MQPIIYHNPRCSKSRETLRLIEEHGLTPRIIEYLKEPPTPDELDRICRMLDLEPVQLIRPREPRLKEIGVTTGDQRSRREWLEILSQNPILIERPIVIVDDAAVLGRPPDNVELLL